MLGLSHVFFYSFLFFSLSVECKIVDAHSSICSRGCSDIECEHEFVRRFYVNTRKGLIDNASTSTNSSFGKLFGEMHCTYKEYIASLPHI